MLLGIDALKRRDGTLLIQGELAAFPDFPVKKLTEKAITIKSARGHSFRACELAVAQLASGRFPLDLLTTHTFGLGDVDRAIRAVGGEVEEDVMHVSLLAVAGLTCHVVAQHPGPTPCGRRRVRGIRRRHGARGAGADRPARART